jgi:hypothetical protein
MLLILNELCPKMQTFYIEDEKIGLIFYFSLFVCFLFHSSILYFELGFYRSFKSWKFGLEKIINCGTFLSYSTQYRDNVPRGNQQNVNTLESGVRLEIRKLFFCLGEQLSSVKYFETISQEEKQPQPPWRLEL